MGKFIDMIILLRDYNIKWSIIHANEVKTGGSSFKRNWDLSEIIQEKILKIIHFFRSEIIESRSSEEKATAEFLSVCGTWEDNRSVEKQIEDIYSSRKSTSRTEK